MAHYVAELIQNIDQVPDRNKAQAKKICFDAILDLWGHRGELPNGKRPFEDIEPIVRAIESLDPENNTPRYFRSSYPPTEPKKETEAQTWIKLADGLDYTAKVLIGHCLGEAARTYADKSQKWVKLAEAAGGDDSASEIVIRFVSPSANQDYKPDQKAELRKKLSDRLTRLESFITLARKVCDDWQTQLETRPRKRQGRPVPK
jgi:hypothetical protein